MRERRARLWLARGAKIAGTVLVLSLLAILPDDVGVPARLPSTSGLHWVRTGGPLGGLGYDVRMRPDNPDVMYVTDAWSGVHKSTDGGKTWQPRNEGITTRAGPSGDAIPVFSLTIDPHNPDVIWCGTQNKRGIFKSTDGGETWTEKVTGVAETSGISFRGFTVDPRDSKVVYAAAEISSFAWTPDGTERMGRGFDLTKGVVYKTTDGGERWSAIWRGNNLARYIWIDPLRPDTVYVSTGIFDREAASKVGIGVLKSTDGGGDVASARIKKWAKEPLYRVAVHAPGGPRYPPRRSRQQRRLGLVGDLPLRGRGGGHGRRSLTSSRPSDRWSSP